MLRPVEEMYSTSVLWSLAVPLAEMKMAQAKGTKGGSNGRVLNR